MHINVRGPFTDFAAVRVAIAQAVAGHPVELREVHREALPDSDGFGGTHHVEWQGQGIRVTETIQSGQDGCARDGFGYDLQWTFTGENGAKARFAAHRTEPRLRLDDEVSLDITDAEGTALLAALPAMGLTGRPW